MEEDIGNIAAWMLKRNVPMEEIAQITKIDMEKIAAISDSIGIKAAASAANIKTNSQALQNL